MSVFEASIIQFVVGPRKGEYAVAVDYKSLISFLDLDGHQLIQWDGHVLQSDPPAHADETRRVREWLDANSLQFVEVPQDDIENRVQQIAMAFQGIKP